MDRKQLRLTLRARRAAVAQNTRAEAALHVSEKLRRLKIFTHAERLAAYLPMAEEFDPMPLLQQARRAGKQCYLPVLHESLLRFAPWSPDSQLKPNRIGIPEPVVSPDAYLTAQQLDLVFVPLVGFDTQCNRLGMGGGYYDRSFAFLLQTQPPPWLIGLAYECQRLTDFAPAAWDVPLHGVITEQACYGNITLEACK